MPDPTPEPGVWQEVATDRGALIRLIDAPPHLGPGLLLMLAMVDRGDTRYAEVHLDPRSAVEFHTVLSRMVATERGHCDGCEDDPGHLTDRGNDDPRPTLPPGDDPRAGHPLPKGPAFL